MNDNVAVRSIWPIPTEQGPAIRALLVDKSDPVLWPMTNDQAVDFAMALLEAVRFNKPPIVR
jgi:hypothetical protein